MKVIDLEIKEPYKELAKLNKVLNKKEKDLERFKNTIAAVFLHDEVKQLRKEIAWLLLNCGEYKKALDAYTSMSWKTEGETKYLGIGIALHKTGKISEAINLFLKGLKRFPESFALIVAVGNIYHEMDSFEMSLEYFKRALVLNPEDRSIAFSKANALYGLGFYEEAFKIYQKLEKQYPDESLFIRQVGYCHLQMGYPEDASGHFKSLLNKGCADPNDYNGLYWAYYDMGLKDDAIETAKEGIRKFPKDDPALYCNLGAVYLEQGWLNDAKDIVSEGLKKFPKDEGLKELLKAIEDEIDKPDDDDKKPPIKEILIISALIKKLRNMRIFRPKK